MILLLDLEATCCNDGSIGRSEMEIIEIGACWATDNGVIDARFQAFVRPILHPILTDYCRALTGIGQDAVDQAVTFAEAALLLKAFAARHHGAEIQWMSWGAFDAKQIEREGLRHVIDHPITHPHASAKSLFSQRQGLHHEVGMRKALALCGLDFQGTHHRALDDAVNIAQLLPFILGRKSVTVEMWPSSACPDGDQ